MCCLTWVSITLSSITPWWHLINAAWGSCSIVVTSFTEYLRKSPKFVQVEDWWSVVWSDNLCLVTWILIVKLCVCLSGFPLPWFLVRMICSPYIKDLCNTCGGCVKWEVALSLLHWLTCGIVCLFPRLIDLLSCACLLYMFLSVITPFCPPFVWSDTIRLFWLYIGISAMLCEVSS